MGKAESISGLHGIIRDAFHNHRMRRLAWLCSCFRGRWCKIRRSFANAIAIVSYDFLRNIVCKAHAFCPQMHLSNVDFEHVTRYSKATLHVKCFAS